MQAQVALEVLALGLALLLDLGLTLEAQVGLEALLALGLALEARLALGPALGLAQVALQALDWLPALVHVHGLCHDRDPCHLHCSIGVAAANRWLAAEASCALELSAPLVIPIAPLGPGSRTPSRR